MMKFHQTLISGVGIILIALLNTCTTVKDDESNVFRYNENNGISTLDPAFARDLEIMWATNQLFDGLVEMNAQFEIIPSIAHSWIISDDAKTYTFYIRDNVFFHDSPVFPNGKGRKVIAQDFVYSFNRIRDPISDLVSARSLSLGSHLRAAPSRGRGRLREPGALHPGRAAGLRPRQEDPRGT